MTTLSCSNFSTSHWPSVLYDVNCRPFREALDVQEWTIWIAFFDAMNCILYPAILNIIVLGSKCNNRFIAFSAQVKQHISTKYLVLIFRVNCLFLQCNRMLPTQLFFMLLPILGGVAIILWYFNASWCCKFTTSYEFKYSNSIILHSIEKSSCKATPAISP